MQGELSTPHQRVIIGSLWSTWRLRAQRKQLSLHPTLDCLSQQTPFPSPLPAFSSKFPPHHNLLWCTERRNGKWRWVCDHMKMLFWTRLLLYCQSCGWGLWPVKILLSLGFGGDLSFPHFTNWKELLSISTSCNRRYIWLQLLGFMLLKLFFKSKQRTFFSPWSLAFFHFILLNVTLHCIGNHATLFTPLKAWSHQKVAW